MPSSDDRTVVWLSLWTCITRLQRHIGVVARIGPLKSADVGAAAVLAAAEVDVDPDVQTWGSEIITSLILITNIICNTITIILF